MWNIKTLGIWYCAIPNTALMQFVQSGTNNPVQLCTAIAHSSGYTVIRPYPDMACSSNTFCQQLSTGWYTIECTFGLLTKNVWYLKMLWKFLHRKWNLHYKCMLRVTLQYNKTAWDLFTYSMEQNPSWEANWFSGSQEILQNLWNPNFRYHIHKRLPAVPILSFSVKDWNHETFLWWGAVGTLPNHQAGGPPLVCCPWLLIQYIRGHPPYWRLFVHPQHNDTPCHVHTDPLTKQH